jgi:hypothetical protein
LDQSNVEVFRFQRSDLFYLKILVYDENGEFEKSVKKFITSNTPVSSFLLGLFICDFSQELKFNFNLLDCDNEEYPWTKYYLERNNQCLEMKKKFNVRPILQVKSFDILFHFQ